MTKGSYLDAKNKLKVRNAFFTIFRSPLTEPKNKLVGLAGPDINNYVQWCNKIGITDLELYELDIRVMMYQLKTFGMIFPKQLIHGDIINAVPNDKNTIYDLDFCGTVKHLTDHIAKFDDNAIMTFSKRISDKQNFEIFFEAKNEEIGFVSKKNNYTVFTTIKNNVYLYIPYMDTSPMCTIAKMPHYFQYTKHY
jgi:hypothetical protein